MFFHKKKTFKCVILMIKYKYEINAWITVSKSLNERKDLILAIILNWKNADLTTEFFCLSNLSDGSKNNSQISCMKTYSVSYRSQSV